MMTESRQRDCNTDVMYRTWDMGRGRGKRVFWFPCVLRGGERKGSMRAGVRILNLRVDACCRKVLAACMYGVNAWSFLSERASVTWLFEVIHSGYVTWSR